MYLLDDKYQVQSVLLWTCLDMFEFVTVICNISADGLTLAMYLMICLLASVFPLPDSPAKVSLVFYFILSLFTSNMLSFHHICILEMWERKFKFVYCFFWSKNAIPVIPILRREMGGDPNLQSSIQLGPCPYQTSHDELGCWFKIYLHAQRLLIFVFDCIV